MGSPHEIARIVGTHKFTAHAFLVLLLASMHFWQLASVATFGSRKISCVGSSFRIRGIPNSMSTLLLCPWTRSFCVKPRLFTTRMLNPSMRPLLAKVGEKLKEKAPSVGSVLVGDMSLQIASLVATARVPNPRARARASQCSVSNAMAGVTWQKIAARVVLSEMQMAARGMTDVTIVGVLRA